MGGVDWHYLRDEFAKQDLYFLDYTPSRRDSHRGEEIKKWLEDTGYDVESYVVIDDEMFDIWDLHEGHMVQTSFDYGDRKSTRLNSSHIATSRMPSSA